MYRSTIVCEDCGTEVPRTGSRQVRCPDCRPAALQRIGKANYRATAEHQKRRARERYQANRKAAAAYARLRNYGLTEEDVAALWDAQDGRCPVCTRDLDPESFSVDHCHATGRVRGLLHPRCNTALGMLWDDPAMLDNGAAYLRAVA